MTGFHLIHLPPFAPWFLYTLRHFPIMPLVYKLQPFYYKKNAYNSYASRVKALFVNGTETIKETAIKHRKKATWAFCLSHGFLFLFILHTHTHYLNQSGNWFTSGTLSYPVLSLLQLWLKQLVTEEIIQTFGLGPTCQLGKTHTTATSSSNFITWEVKKN